MGNRLPMMPVAPRMVSCESAGAEVPYPKAFPEIAKQVPLTPEMDETKGYGKYQWGYEAVPMSQKAGGRTYDETTDAQNHKTPKTVFPTDFRAFHTGKFGEDRINQQYEHMLSDHVNLSGAPAPTFSTNYEKSMAYHFGLYVPEVHQPTKTADDIRLAVSDYADKVHQDNPKDACKYLQIEEFRCLQVYQYETNPQMAGKKCMKWWDEWNKCQWDQEKFNAGTTYLEGPQMRKRRAYLFYPDFKYA
eukprot:gnl/MRDRNA2_/MRDRNA2_60296_c0_seq1.p1 gnl/MRDRNA2_/MRDRNA2_60296_c0~~gnl/MRDRNA2_/MRDRNA2_60296_c0_seq1.p1  ORF type:complete len:246 (-),score=37.83 gnl/MRDRNA2_/MRDRNA2_60296_c0_seq1:5-742(-)